jgi:hypothetical protein
MELDKRTLKMFSDRNVSLDVLDQHDKILVERNKDIDFRGLPVDSVIEILSNSPKDAKITMHEQDDDDYSLTYWYIFWMEIETDDEFARRILRELELAGTVKKAKLTQEDKERKELERLQKKYG